MIDIQSLIEELKLADSPRSLEIFLEDLSNSLKLDHYWYMTIPPETIRDNAALITLNNYPKEFVDEYISDRRMFRDPVVIGAYSQLHEPLLWNELFDHKSLNEEQMEQLEWGSNFGILNGISHPIHEPCTQFTLLHFVMSEKIANNSVKINTIKNTLSALSALIHSNAKTIFNKNNDDNSKFSTKLTRRETECLIWAARGKTSWETAKILSLSESTVNEYLSHSIKKLNSATKVEAVAKAILYGEINTLDVIYKP